MALDPSVQSNAARNGDSEQLLALTTLEPYPSAHVSPFLQAALQDPSPRVRRSALEQCTRRKLVDCVPFAETLWRENDDLSVQMAALSLLVSHIDQESPAADDGSSDSFAFLSNALRRPQELLRAHAADLLGIAALPASVETRVRRELVTLLVDPAARVRQSAAKSLGRCGPGEGALALVRLLEDPDTGVRNAAVEALGQLEDPRATPALRRLLEFPGSAQIARSAVFAIAMLPDPSIGDDLLRLFDAPPRFLERRALIRAMGLRPHAGPVFFEGLMKRLHVPVHTDAVLQILAAQGEAARPALTRALDEGLETHLKLPVADLLRALDYRARTIAIR